MNIFLKTSFFCAIGALSACAVPPPSQQVQASAQTVQAKIPFLTPAPETKVTQAKDGISLTVIPYTYDLKKVPSVKEVESAPTMQEALLMGLQQKKRVIEKTSTESIAVTPDNLAFQIAINNGLSHVFRAAGAVVQFNVCGVSVPVRKESYSQLDGIILTPRSEQKINVFGPPLAALGGKESCVVGIFIYDVPTATDAAGNVTAKQNFEWYFDLMPKTKEISISEPVVSRVFR